MQLNCVKGNDAICGHARPIQGMASTYGAHQGNVPQGQRGTQVDAPWHSYKCSTGMFHGARQGTLSSQARDSSPRFKQALDIAGTDHMNTAHLNTRPIISATLRYDGGRGATEKLFLSLPSIHPPQKNCYNGVVPVRGYLGIGLVYCA